MHRIKQSRGSLVGRILSGAWRKPPFPPLDITQDQLDEATPLLNGSSAGALAWWRIGKTAFRGSASAEVLRQAYRFHSVQAVMHEEKIKKVFRLLKEASIEAVMAKGWSATALYPAAPLRPYHDIDIYVRARDFPAAESVFTGPGADDCWVDLHNRFWELDDRNQESVFARSKMVALGEEQICTLGAEDHLALLAIHFLKHGGWRPLWLCDIGAAIEGLSDEFDWEICLGRNPVRANWIVHAIGLAQRLLGARIDTLPKAIRVPEPPSWLIESVLSQWANPFPLSQSPAVHPIPMGSYLKRPRGVINALRHRWPNPIAATVILNGKFNSLPRLPYQVGNCMLRAGQFVFRLPRTAD